MKILATENDIEQDTPKTEPVIDKTSEQETVTDKPAKKNNSWIWKLIGLLIFLGLCYAAYLYSQKQKEQKQ